MITTIAGLIFITVALAAVPYVWWVKHPQMRPLAAYLIFLTVFAAAGWVTFMTLSTFLLWAGAGDIANNLVWITLVGASSTLVGLALGSLLVRMKPPPQRRPD